MLRILRICMVAGICSGVAFGAPKRPAKAEQKDEVLVITNNLDQAVRVRTVIEEDALQHLTRVAEKQRRIIKQAPQSIQSGKQHTVRTDIDDKERYPVFVIIESAKKLSFASDWKAYNKFKISTTDLERVGDIPPIVPKYLQGPLMDAKGNKVAMMLLDPHTLNDMHNNDKLPINVTISKGGTITLA